MLTWTYHSDSHTRLTNSYPRDYASQQKLQHTSTQGLTVHSSAWQQIYAGRQEDDGEILWRNKANPEPFTYSLSHVRDGVEYKTEYSAVA